MKSQILEMREMGHMETDPVNAGIRVECYPSIAAVPREVWNGGMTLPTPMRYEFLELVEKSGINDLRHWNLRMTTAGTEQARANLFLSETDFSTFDAKPPPSGAEAADRIFATARLTPMEMPRRSATLEAGIISEVDA